jgi:DNA end-binding protein Ku
MAKQLVDALTTTFEPERYKDEHRERVLELIEKKAEGEEIVAPPQEEAPARVVSLMDALAKSLEAKGELRRPRAQAAKQVRKKGAKARKKKAS